ncbi:hypothetical protein KRR40_03710 [Niabella defluvii]|nr:hypothetical protein KRR40_03710 [Niabella sp. I65]
MSIQTTLIKANKAKIALQKLPEKQLKGLLQAIAHGILKNEAAILKANKKTWPQKNRTIPKTTV